jgi:hypothetical protein
MLIAGLGNRQGRQGESRKARIDDRRHRKFRPGEWVSVTPIEHHPPLTNAISRAALQPPKLAAPMAGNAAGNCYDNAIVETFFKTIKAELVWRRTWETHR